LPDTIPKVEPGTCLVVRTDGSEQLLPSADLETVRAALGGDLDFVTLTADSFGRPDLIMAVLDIAWEVETVNVNPGHVRLVPTRPLFPINERATVWYRAAGGDPSHQIAGDVALMHDRGAR
jgi:hypothetical protein